MDACTLGGVTDSPAPVHLLIVTADMPQWDQTYAPHVPQWRRISHHLGGTDSLADATVNADAHLTRVQAAHPAPGWTVGAWQDAPNGTTRTAHNGAENADEALTVTQTIVVTDRDTCPTIPAPRTLSEGGVTAFTAATQPLTALTGQSPEAAPAGPDSMFCEACAHPHGYHQPDRGCTMPVDRDGLPASRNSGPTTPCRCGESDEHKMDRLTRARDAAYEAWSKAVEEQVAHARAMQDKQSAPAPQDI